MARDKYGNSQEALETFAHLIQTGGMILCHPLQYFAILQASKEWELDFDLKSKLRPNVAAQRNHVVAVHNSGRTQTIQFR
jgi:hypothetical protein